MPRSRSLLIVGLVALVAAAAGGLIGSGWLGDDPAREMPATTGSVASSTPPKDRSMPPRALPAPSLFVAPDGDDGGPCSAARPCASLDRAYHQARPGQVVQLAGGAYGSQSVTADPGKDGRGCESRGVMAACVILRPAAGARVELENLNLGDDYKQPGPAGLAIVADHDRRMTTASTNLNQAHEVALWGLDQRNFYVAGGSDMAIRDGRVGGQTSDDGLHPEVQGVYGSVPAIVPTRLTIEDVVFHDINTTSPTAHVDCLQVESAVDLVVRGNTFKGCGSTGLRISYGGGSNENPPRHLLIENNVFRRCVDTPVSPCYYAAQVGIGHDVLVRGNVAEQDFQPAGDAKLMQGVRYVGNIGPGVACEPGVAYVDNAWLQGTCSSSDRRLEPHVLEAALRGDPKTHGAPAVG